MLRGDFYYYGVIFIDSGLQVGPRGRAPWAPLAPPGPPGPRWAPLGPPWAPGAVHGTAAGGTAAGGDDISEIYG